MRYVLGLRGSVFIPTPGAVSQTTKGASGVLPKSSEGNNMSL